MKRQKVAKWKVRVDGDSANLCPLEEMAGPRKERDNMHQPVEIYCSLLVYRAERKPYTYQVIVEGGELKTLQCIITPFPSTAE